MQDGPFVWNEPLQGLILSAYFWGYMVSLLPGGRMAELLSAKWVMNGSICTHKRSSVYTVTCCGENALLPLHRDEIHSRNRWS